MKKAIVLFLALAMMSVAVPAFAAVGDLNSYDSITWDFSDYTAAQDDPYPVPTNSDARTYITIDTNSHTGVRLSPISIDGDTAMLLETSHGKKDATGEGVDIWDIEKSTYVGSTSGGFNVYFGAFKRDDNYKGLSFEFSFMLPDDWEICDNAAYNNTRFFSLQHQREVNSRYYQQFMVAGKPDENPRVGFYQSAYDNCWYPTPWADEVVGVNGVTNTTVELTDVISLEKNHWYRFVNYTDYKGQKSRLILLDGETGQIIGEDFHCIDDLKPSVAEGAGGNVAKYHASAYPSMFGDSSYYNFGLGANMKIIIDDIKLSLNQVSNMMGKPLLGYKENGGYSSYRATSVASNNKGVLSNKVEDVVNAEGYTGTISVPVNLISHAGGREDGTYYNGSAGNALFSNNVSGKAFYCALVLYEDGKMIDVDVKKFDGFAQANSDAEMRQTLFETLSVDLAKADMDPNKDYTLKRITLDDQFKPMFEPDIAY